MVTQISCNEAQRARTTVKGSGRMAWQRASERMLHVSVEGDGGSSERSMDVSNVGRIGGLYGQAVEGDVRERTRLSKIIMPICMKAM